MHRRARYSEEKEERRSKSIQKDRDISIRIECYALKIIRWYRQHAVCRIGQIITVIMGPTAHDGFIFASNIINCPDFVSINTCFHIFT
jgi:hypothetical protein